MSEPVTIVDRGKGPQLSTSRITVQDLLPYYRKGASNEEIKRWMTSLTDEEIEVLRAYISTHYEEVLQDEKEIAEYRARQRAMQPAWTRANDHLSIEERRQRLLEKVRQRQAEKNGDNHSPR